MVVVFFVGLIIMASGGAISNICNIEYMNVICNIVGGSIMGSITYFFTKSEMIRKKELKQLHEKEVDALLSMETLMQKQVIDIIKENSAIKEKLFEVKDSLSELIENSLNTMDILQLHADRFEKSNTTIVDSLNTIDNRIDSINVLPQTISESIDTLIVKFGNTIEKIETNYKNLTEDIEDQEKDRTKKYNSIMNEIRDSAEESNGEMTEEIKKLAGQYEMFETTITTIVERMSHMAEEDLKVLKGFLNE